MATFPGLVAPDGTVQVYVYVPAGVGVAVTVAGVPAQTGRLVTATVGVASVSGAGVDNTDPRNPIINIPTVTGFLPLTAGVGEEITGQLISTEGTIWLKNVNPIIYGSIYKYTNIDLYNGAGGIDFHVLHELETNLDCCRCDAYFSLCYPCFSKENASGFRRS